MTNYRITVIVPAHNRVEFLPGALQTIRGQNMPELEVLLIDDGSTDGLREAADQCAGELRYIGQQHRGASAARNRGIQEAAGEFLAFLDIDDIWAPCHLTRLLDSLRLRPEAGIAQGLMCQMVEAPEGSSWKSAAYRMPYLGSCVFRRWVFEKCGLFDETMASGEDYDFLFRCWENDVPKIPVNGLSLLYRRHSGNLTTGRNHSAHLLVLKRRIERIKAGLVDPAAQRQTPFQTYIGDLTGIRTEEWQAAAWIH